MTAIETRLLENQMMIMHALRCLLSTAHGSVLPHYNALELAIAATHKVLHEPEESP